MEKVSEQSWPYIYIDKSGNTAFPIQTIPQNLPQVHLTNPDCISVHAANVIETDLAAAAADAHTSNASQRTRQFYILNTRYEISETSPNPKLYSLK